MVLVTRPLLADEELGKKDDDHRPVSGRRTAAQMAHWKTPRPRRVLIAIAACLLLYLFFKDMPTGLRPAEERYNARLAQLRQNNREPESHIPGAPTQDQSQSDGGGRTEHRDYEGPILFIPLANSLRLLRAPLNRHAAGRAVVFAASNLKSVSDLIPLACEMARQRRNDVHLVLMGRDDISIGGLQEVNGISDDACPITWHDARPDQALRSTDSRMQRAVTSGLAYVLAYIRPQAVITLSQSREDAFFFKGVDQKTHESGTPHIVLPMHVRDLMWIANLDSDALHVWNDVHIEILIHAQPDSSGSVIRLLRSLSQADFLGTTPAVTLELPLNVDPMLLHYLQHFEWPPQMLGKLTIRRRIRPQDLTSTEASIRTVEAFYPRDPRVSHVLILSAQTELAPSFFHYLKYLILHYQQSGATAGSSSKLLGISLDLPTTSLTDGEPFIPPSAPHIQDPESLPLFLWQSPNSNAALYFGDKWAEFHTFLSRRLAAATASGRELTPERLVSTKYPAFMEHLLEFSRAYGHYMIYPLFPTRGTFSLATIHNELSKPPEEFLSPNDPTKTDPEGQVPENQLESLTTTPFKEIESAELPLNYAPTIMSLLDRFSRKLPTLGRMDIVSYNGEILSAEDHSAATEKFSDEFRTKYGGCADGLGTFDGPEMELFCTEEM